MFQRFSRFKSRKPTETAFKGTETVAKLPSAPTKTPVPESSTSVPSYGHADRQKGAKDANAESKEKEDEEIRITEGGNKDAVPQPKTGLPKGKGQARGDQREDGPATTTSINADDHFTRFWKLELDTDLEEVTESATNYWTPNAFALFEILSASSIFVYANQTVIKRHSDYLDFAVAVYYSIIFYIQILRAQHAAGKLSGPDRSFFNRFKDRFKFEELPVSSIMFPYLSTIVSTLPADQKYDWVIPRYANDLFKANWEGVFDIRNGGAYIQPMVPYMLRILRTAIVKQNITLMQTTPDDYFNDKDQYITHTIAARGAANATVLFGTDYNLDTTQIDDRNALMSMCGVRYPFEADLGTLSLAATQWRKSKFEKFPYGVRTEHGLTIDSKDPTAVPLVPNVRRTDAGGLDAFLHMEKDAEVDWFFELISQAITNARFFGKAKNLSDVPTTSGNETLIGCKFRKVTRGAFVADHNVQLGLRPRAVNRPSWNPDTFEGYVSSFYTTRAAVTREETLQALTFGTQGSINVTYNDAAGNAHRVGTGPQFMTGPYWTNKQWAATRYEDLNTSRVGKPMFKGWKTMFQESAAQEKPEGY